MSICIIDYTTLLAYFKIIVPGPAGYSYNKVAVAVTDFKYRFCLKRCDLILFTWSKFKLTDMLLWQQLQDELQRTKWSKIRWNRQQSNPAKWVSEVRRTDPSAGLLAPVVLSSSLCLFSFRYRTEQSYFYMEYKNMLIIIFGLWHTFRIIL